VGSTLDMHVFRKLAQEFAADASPQTRFLNVLVTSTTF
jgi:hypothetical protein